MTTTLQNTANIGDNTIAVPAASEIEGWSIGDTVTIGQSTRSATNQTEKRTVSSISGTNITLNSNLSYRHVASSTVVSSPKSRSVWTR